LQKGTHRSDRDFKTSRFKIVTANNMIPCPEVITSKVRIPVEFLTRREYK